MPSAPKLPQARLYLRAAVWGLDQLVERRLEGRAFVFHMIGILSALRTVQFALFNHDQKISAAHEIVITEWRQRTPLATPELKFIKSARDLILKEGAFKSFAIYSESGIGEGDNYTVTEQRYELEYCVGGERRDLLVDLRNAFDWCEAQLSNIEDQLPEILEP